MKARIVKVTTPGGRVYYEIQQRHILFFWWWVPAWVNRYNPYATTDFNTLEEAKKNLCYYDGTKYKKEVVYGARRK